MMRRDFLKAGVAALAAGERLTQAAKREMKVLLWNWDARMTWDDEPARIATKMAASEKTFPYLKRPEAYLVGGKRLVDYCAKVGIYGFCLWGFLRDSHGGVKAARDLCKYAADRGVALLPGVGLCSYGGYYYEGDHPFNLQTYLRKHPDRISTAHEEGGGRKVTPVLDPSLPENQKWWRDGLEWMLETFQVGGINYEMGDFIVNPSERAVKARAALKIDCDENIKEIVVATQDLFKYGFSLQPDTVLINSTYRGLERITGFPEMPYIDVLPSQTVWEYNLRGTVRKPDFAQRYQGTPKHRTYGYLHWFNSSTNTMDKDYVAEIARVFPGAHKLDFEFIGTYGEVSAVNNPLADRNYRAQVAWAGNPGLQRSEFDTRGMTATPFAGQTRRVSAVTSCTTG
jgi:hypothetical protein